MTAKHPLRLRARWRIADLMNRLPGQCWSDLVNWVLFDRGWWPLRPVSQVCRDDRDRTGTCYCGMLTTTRRAETPR